MTEKKKCIKRSFYIKIDMKGFFMAKYKVDICGINTNNLRTLKNSEMIKLFNAYKSGDDSVKELENVKYDPNRYFKII